MPQPVLCCDLDGVVWLGDEPIPGAARAVERLRSAGIRVVFATNNSSATLLDYAARLARVGIPVDTRDIVSSATAAARWCRGEFAPDARLLLHAGAGVREALRDAGFTDLTDAGDAAPTGDRFAFDAVVCGWHRTFDFERLARAADAVRAGARFVATNLDPTYPDAARRLPGNGALVAAVAAAGGRPPDVVTGKPEPAMVDLVRARAGAEPGIVVGDRVTTDGALAARLGWPFALVLSGVSGPGGEEPVPEPAPEYVVRDLRELADRLVAPATASHLPGAPDGSDSGGHV